MYVGEKTSNEAGGPTAETIARPRLFQPSGDAIQTLQMFVELIKSPVKFVEGSAVAVIRLLRNLIGERPEHRVGDLQIGFVIRSSLLIGRDGRIVRIGHVVRNVIGGRISVSFCGWMRDAVIT